MHPCYTFPFALAGLFLFDVMIGTLCSLVQYRISNLLLLITAVVSNFSVSDIWLYATD